MNLDFPNIWIWKVKPWCSWVVSDRVTKQPNNQVTEKPSIQGLSAEVNRTLS